MRSQGSPDCCCWDCLMWCSLALPCVELACMAAGDQLQD